MIQLPGDLQMFDLILDAIAPRTILEIGTWTGEFAVWLAERTDYVITVDHPCSDMRLSLEAEADREERLARWPTSVRLVRGDSHLAETRDRVVDALVGRPIDLLVLDGDHSRVGLARDLELYSPLLNHPGWVAVHDTDSIEPHEFCLSQVRYMPQVRITSYGVRGYGWTFFEVPKGDE